MSKIEFENGDVVIDAELVAARFSLDPATFLERIRNSAIRSVLERGEGADAGRFRLTFIDANQRVRFEVDAQGAILREATIGVGFMPASGSREQGRDGA